ncbi:MAG: [FeFe] hydrogenase H-cluster radical SAM maturase HydG [Candidatus Abyssobacteria bacterium SURF_17]|uniref:histidine kinase n=1 Tax=Candidatus Abyssobacteria bacterium SURF_17 TaxID=2093361 RepID=A0A419ERR2_9BACT|nr:MAG: [FeFe] hydrogenase H-cluster radical SAM maturase HydG [Candidatus Abyssubacteria bacterium SURF_17]
MPNSVGVLNLPEEVNKRKRIILGELKERTVWFVRLRWWVPPCIATGTVVGRLVGVEFSAGALFGIAAFILAYNMVFARWGRSLATVPVEQTDYIQRFTYCQVTLDYAAMFLLIHFTGGVSSPLTLFFIFHIIFASILLRPRSAYGFAALAAAGMALVSLGEYLGWISHHSLIFHGRTLNLIQSPFHMMVNLIFFTTTVFITAFSTTAIMSMLRKRIVSLAELSEELTTLNNKLRSLYVMTQAIVSNQRLEHLMNITTSELAAVMNVQGMSVKLLSDDGKVLRYAAAYGLPSELIRDKVIEVAKSPLNRRIIEGDPFVTGHVTQRELFQFGEDLKAAQVRSVLFVPLTVEDRVTGILGAYSKRAEEFGSDDVDFFRLAAGLVAIALENARYYEEIEEMVKERSRFMMRVTHNLRAPLAAAISILDVVQGKYLGDLNDRQLSYLRRIEYPIRNMLSMINELMVLYAQRRDKRSVVHKVVDVSTLMRGVQRTFQTEAEKKGICFETVIPDAVPGIKCDEEMIQQMFENLISNAIKYTPTGGRVKMLCTCDDSTSVKIEVSDTGIGIPQADIPRIFNEFFRTQSARDMEKIGTGLGLSIVKEIVSQHGGRITVESKEEHGSTFTVHLPVAPQEGAQKSVGIEIGGAPKAFIDEGVIQNYIDSTARVGDDRVKEVIKKARELKGLHTEEAAVLLQCTSPAVTEEMFQAAHEVKKSIFGNRLVVFAPLYVSSFCREDCKDCFLRVSDRKKQAKALSQGEIAEEVRLIERRGHKRVLLVAGNGVPHGGLDYLLQSIATIWSTHGEEGEIRHVSLNAPPFAVKEFRQLKASKIAAYQLFQETYHVPTFKKLHGEDSSAEYTRRLNAIGHAFEGGISDSGISLLFGLYDYRFEVLALLQHIRHLEHVYGIGPRTLGLFRLKPAKDSSSTEQSVPSLTDSDFKRVIAVLRLAVPYAGIVTSTQAPPEMQAEMFTLGVSQVSAGSRTDPSSRVDGELGIDSSRGVDGARNLDDAILPLVNRGHIPSFCTACYKLGRTGAHFMNLAKPGLIKDYCLPNAILTFKEYLEDYAGSEVREAGLALIRKASNQISSSMTRAETEKRVGMIEHGERHLYF